MVATAMKVREWNDNGKNYAFFFKPQGELKKKVGRSVDAEFFMSDDDPKYFNAWAKIMDSKPRKLLCSWHVIKNWNIQGRTKITDPNLKQSMKKDLKKIMNHTRVERFAQCKEEYLKKLEHAQEYEFLNYLKKYYFQNEERIKMWAHCFRVNSGINTNMAIESLNNFLKTNQLKRRSNVTVERLLDALDTLVDNKMWHRILNMERPNTQSYQNRVIMKAHKTAESVDQNLVKEVGFGEFQVTSSHGNDFYSVSYNELCERECRTLFCQACKICIHRYRCDCQQYAVKTTICKHVHLVCMYERGRGANSVLDDVIQSSSQSQIETLHNEEVEMFINEKDLKETSNLEREERRKVEDENLLKYLRGLDDEAHQEVLTGIYELINKKERNKTNDTKRKMEKQSYYQSKKFKR